MTDTRVLIVDDSHSIRRVVHNTLIGLGLTRVMTESNGTGALERLIFVDVDLIIVNWRVTGAKFMKKLHGNEGMTNLPVIVMVGHPEESDIKEAMESGVAGFIVKPFTGERLVSAAGKALNMTFA